MVKSVSLIVTVLNEQGSIAQLLDSILAQTRQPDEVVIVDGGSGDGTVETILGYGERLPIKVIVRPGCNISRGRNIAIEASSGEAIASTDAGVRLSPNWLADLMRPLEDGTCEVVSGFFLPDPQTVFEAAMGATVLPAVDEIDPKEFLPSSRSVAFIKEAWTQVGGYPEWLDFCEDLIFDFDLRGAGYRFGWAPEAVAHFRPRSSVRAYYKQYYRYARGDGKANLWLKRHIIRYATYILPLVALVVSPPEGRFPLLLLLLVAGAFYLAQPYRRLLTLRGKRGRGGCPLGAGERMGRRVSRDAGGLSRRSLLEAALWIPVIRLTGDIAKMAGYPAGVLWRVKRGKGEEGKRARH